MAIRLGRRHLVPFSPKVPLPATFDLQYKQSGDIPSMCGWNRKMSSLSSLLVHFRIIKKKTILDSSV
jgi:hypothetical protein